MTEKAIRADKVIALLEEGCSQCCLTATKGESFDSPKNLDSIPRNWFHFVA